MHPVKGIPVSPGSSLTHRIKMLSRLRQAVSRGIALCRLRKGARPAAHILQLRSTALHIADKLFQMACVHRAVRFGRTQLTQRSKVFPVTFFNSIKKQRLGTQELRMRMDPGCQRRISLPLQLIRLQIKYRKPRQPLAALAGLPVHQLDLGVKLLL